MEESNDTLVCWPLASLDLEIKLGTDVPENKLTCVAKWIDHMVYPESET